MPKKAKYRKEDTPKRVFRSTNKHKQKKCIQLRREYLDPEREFLEPRRTIHKMSPFCNALYQYYKRKKGKWALTQKKYFRLINLFLKKAYRHIVVNEAGLFIERFGYLFIQRSNIRARYKRRKNLRTRGYMYFTTFVPIRPDTKLNVWTMDRAFSPKIVRMLKSRLYKGFVYKSAFTPLNNMYGLQKVNLKIKDDYNT